MGGQTNREPKYDRPISNAAPGTRFDFLVTAFSILDGKGATSPEQVAKLEKARAVRDANFTVSFGHDIMRHLGLSDEQIDNLDPHWAALTYRLLSNGLETGSRDWRATLAATPSGAFALGYDDRINLRALVAATSYLQSLGVTRPKDILAWLNSRRGPRQGETGDSTRTGGLTRDSLRSAKRMLGRYLAACPDYVSWRLNVDTVRVRLLIKVRAARMPHTSSEGGALALALDTKFGLALEVLRADGGQGLASQNEHVAARLFCVEGADNLGWEVPYATRYPPGLDGRSSDYGRRSGKDFWPVHHLG